MLDFSKLLIESDFLFGHRNANDTCSWAPRTEIRYQCYYCDRGRDTNAKDDKDIIDTLMKVSCKEEVKMTTEVRNIFLIKIKYILIFRI